MQTISPVVSALLGLPLEHLHSLIALAGLAVVALALYVVLTVLKVSKRQ